MSLIQVLNIRLQRTDCNTPWGFSLQGGNEFHSPIVIHKVTFLLHINSLVVIFFLNFDPIKDYTG